MKQREILSLLKTARELIFQLGGGPLDLAAHYGPDFEPPNDQDILHCYHKLCQGIETIEKEEWYESEENARLIAAAPDLLKALIAIRDTETECCPRCAGNGRLWADGQAHYPSYQGSTVDCGNCGGSGRLQPQDVREIAAEAIAKAEGK